MEIKKKEKKKKKIKKQQSKGSSRSGIKSLFRIMGKDKVTKIISNLENSFLIVIAR